MNHDEFSDIVREALDGLPEEFRKGMENIEIVVEDRPPPEILEKLGSRMLLGLYQGVPITKRSRYYAGVLPDKISIYREPILRVSVNRHQAVENIRKVLLHEIGHYFGITDKELRRLGY